MEPLIQNAICVRDGRRGIGTLSQFRDLTMNSAQLFPLGRITARGGQLRRQRLGTSKEAKEIADFPWVRGYDAATDLWDDLEKSLTS
jgi:hypothetical protein